jgi:uncharacterized protein YpuA (DUF1002 family)
LVAVKGKGESEARNYDEELAPHEEVKALREAKEKAGTHQGALAGQIDEIKSLKAEHKSEARNNEEELAALLDEIRILSKRRNLNLIMITEHSLHDLRKS